MSRQQQPNRSAGNQQYRTESVATSHVDLYKVLGLESTCANGDIERQYSQLVKQYHPDKVRLRHTMMITEMSRNTPIPDSKRTELDDALMRKVEEAKEMFNLINTAYQRLTNDRSGYDAEHSQFTANAEDNFTSMRGGAKAFMDAQGTVATDRDQANFRAQWLEMNRRHGFDQDTAGVALKEQDTNDRLRTLRQQRDQMEVDTRPDRVFDPKNNLGQFNAVFERTYGQRGTGGEIMPFDSSDIGNIGGGGDTGGMFGEIGKVDNLYTDEAGGSFAPVVAENLTRITRQDLVGVVAADTTFNHNIKSQDDRDDMKRRTEEYNNFGKQLQNRTMSDYSTEFQYGGIVAGLESAQPQRLERLEFAANPQQVGRYRDLLASHQRVHDRQRPVQPQLQQQQQAGAAASSVMAPMNPMVMQQPQQQQRAGGGGAVVQNQAPHTTYQRGTGMAGGYNVLPVQNQQQSQTQIIPPPPSVQTRPHASRRG